MIMKRLKKMGVTIAILFTLGLFGLLILFRTINIDNYILLRTDKQYYSELVVDIYGNVMVLIPQIEEGQYSLGLGRSRHISMPKNNLYLYNYNFKINANTNFVLTDQHTGQQIILGNVISENKGPKPKIMSYRIKIPDDYTAYHQEAESIIPYYRLSLTLLSASELSFDYSWEIKTVLIAPNGDKLQYYRSLGHIDNNKKSGIFNSE